MPGEASQDVTDMSDARLSKHLGVRIAEARKLRGLTLRTLADVCACSDSLISRIENGKAHPSLQVLNRLAEALNVSMSWLFDGLDGGLPMFSRTRENPGVHSCKHVITAKQLFAADDMAILRCHILNIEVGAESESVQLQEGEEVSYLLEGSIELTVDGRLHRLSVGDAFALKADQSYRFRNVGPIPAGMLLVGTQSTVGGLRKLSTGKRRARPWIHASPRSEMVF